MMYSWSLDPEIAATIIPLTAIRPCISLQPRMFKFRCSWSLVQFGLMGPLMWDRRLILLQSSNFLLLAQVYIVHPVTM